MKSLFLRALLCATLFSTFFIQNSTAQISFGDPGVDPDSSAVLDLQSTNKGMLVPRMTTAQRTDIAGPALGLLVFDTDTESFWYRDSAEWVRINGGVAFSQGLLLNEDCYNEESLDAHFQVPGGSSELTQNAWQSFTAEKNGYLTRVEIRTSDLEPLENGTFRLYEGEGTGGPLLFEMNLNQTIDGWGGFDLPADSLLLSADSVYTLRFSNSNDFEWSEKEANPYPNGRASFNADNDFQFRTYLTECKLHYVVDATTSEGTTNLNYIDTIFYSDGTYQTSGHPSFVSDEDQDTKINLEESPDEDAIRFDLKGNEHLVLKRNAAGFTMLEFPYSTVAPISSDNIFIGKEAGLDFSDGSYNVLIGSSAGKFFNDGISNTFIGYEAGANNQTGWRNTFLGKSAGLTNNGSYNVFLGYDAGSYESGSNRLYIENSDSNSPLIYGEFDNDLLRINGDLEVTGGFPGSAEMVDADGDTKIQVEESADEDLIRFDIKGNEYFLFDSGRIITSNNNNNLFIGSSTLPFLTTGERNVSLGKASGIFLETGEDNTLVGYGAGFGLKGGNQNTLVGSDAGSGLINQTGNVFIGYKAGKMASSSNNKLFIENSDSNSPLIYGEFDNDLVRINGNLEVTGTFPSSDNQSIDVLNLNGTTLEISLLNDGQATKMLDLASIDTDTDTDDQAIDVLNLNGTTLEISLEDDGQPTQTLDLAGIDTDTDDQTIDKLNLNGTTLEISLENDGQPDQTLDLSSINSVQTIIEDADGDTKIQVEESADEDVVRISVAGTEIFTLSKNANNYTLVETPHSGNNSTLFGQGAGESLTMGQYNTFFGKNAGNQLTGGGENTIIGGRAGLAMTHQSGNTIIGFQAGENSSGDKNIFLGFRAGTHENGDNKLYIENSVSQNPLIYGEFDNDLVRINGDLEVTGTFPGSDDQTIDVLNLNGATLEISLEDDGQATQTVDLSSIDTDTDDQTIDVLNLNGTVLEISLEDDGQVTQTVDLSSLVPVGTINMFYGTTAPAGWLICDGSTFNASTYPDLNALLGGNTLPDFSGRFPLGVGDSGTAGSTSHAFGSDGGEEKHTLIEDEMPTHGHTVTIGYREGEEQGSGNDYSDLGAPVAEHTHSKTYDTNLAGDGDPHNNMPPFLTVNFIIKAK